MYMDFDFKDKNVLETALQLKQNSRKKHSFWIIDLQWRRIKSTSLSPTFIIKPSKHSDHQQVTVKTNYKSTCELSVQM